MPTKLDTSGIRMIIAGLDDAVDRGAKNGAEMIGDLAQQFAPEKTGELKRSKRVVRAPGKRRWKVVFTAPHAKFVEYGTRYSAAQPYLTPATRAIDVTEEIGKEVRALIRRASK